MSEVRGCDGARDSCGIGPGGYGGAGIADVLPCFALNRKCDRGGVIGLQSCPAPYQLPDEVYRWSVLAGLWVFGSLPGDVSWVAGRNIARVGVGFEGLGFRPRPLLSFLAHSSRVWIGFEGRSSERLPNPRHCRTKRVGVLSKATVGRVHLGTRDTCRLHTLLAPSLPRSGSE